MSKPRVSVEHHIDGIRTRSVGGELDYTNPEVRIEVSFDLHDHQAALAMLAAAVAHVREQIEETK